MKCRSLSGSALYARQNQSSETEILRKKLGSMWGLGTVNILKFQKLFFLFWNKMTVIRTGIYKLLVQIAKREDPDQNASSEAV